MPAFIELEHVYIYVQIYVPFLPIQTHFTLQETSMTRALETRTRSLSFYLEIMERLYLNLFKKRVFDAPDPFISSSVLDTALLKTGVTVLLC